MYCGRFYLDHRYVPCTIQMYECGRSASGIYQYSLSTAWSLSTATYNSVYFDVVSQGDPTDLFFKSDGTRMYVLIGAYGNGKIYEYNLP